MQRLTRAPLVLGGLVLLSCATASLQERDGTRQAEPVASKQSALPAQSDTPDLGGRWHRALELGSRQIPFDAQLSPRAEHLEGTLSVPAQGLRDVPLEGGRQDGRHVRFSMRLPTGARVSFDGTWSDERIEGTFQQGPAKVPFWMMRGERSAAVNAPIPEGLREEPLTAHNGSIRLAGTLTVPADVERPPVAILISGSGPQSRDQDLFGMPVFKLLAHALARQGIATLRYDDRGVGESTGDFYAATTADFALDTEAWFHQLSKRTDVDAKRIGLVGHSEGGMVAPMVAAKLPAVAFIVLLAGPGQRMDELLLEQVARVGRAEGHAPEKTEQKLRVTRRAAELLRAGKDLSSMEEALLASCDARCEPVDEWIKATRWQMESPWFRYFIAYDPAPILQRVRSPVLALGGSLDLQVPSDLNLPLIQKALARGGNRSVTIAEIPGMNHLLQQARTGAVSEYARLPKELEPTLALRIAEWLRN